MKAKKENKVYRIMTEQEKQRYLKDGFDIYDDDGKLMEYSPLKKIEYGKYEAVKKELEALKKEAGNADDKDVIDILNRYAKEHEIDLGRTSTISGIIKKIKEYELGEGE